MQDRIAPQCPLCNQVVASTPNGDPNEAVDRHLGLGTCTGLPGGEDRRKAVLKQKKDKGEVCWRKGCAKTIVVQIKCDSCKHTFCPTHRTTAAHSCSETSTPGSSRGTTPQPLSKQNDSSKNIFTRTSKPTPSPSQPSKLGSSSTHPTSSSTSNPTPITASLDAKSAAAAAALRRAGQDVKVPFVKTKTEKRSKDEHNSALQALKARHDKGLLSKEEEVKYADMLGKKESGRRKSESGKKGDCVIA